MQESLFNQLPPLKQGDVVDLIAPSYGTSARGVKDCVRYIESLGLVPRLPDDLLGEDLHCANSDENRIRDLTNALSNTESKAVWCIRGGYGATRIVPGLRDMPKPKTPKWLIGFSDITCLHLAIHTLWGWPTLHAPVLLQCARDEVDAESRDALIQLLFGTLPLPLKPEPLNRAAKEQGTLPAVPVTGGNLSLIQCSIGTFWQCDAKGKLLFVEEVGERGYGIERMLTHLRQAGVGTNAAAILIGDMTEGEEKDGSEKVSETIRRFAHNTCLPVYRLTGYGHAKRNFPLVMNAA